MGLQFLFILHINNHIQSGQRHSYPHLVSLAKAESRGLGRAPGQEKHAGMDFGIPLQPSGMGLCVLLSRVDAFALSPHPDNPAVHAVAHS